MNAVLTADFMWIPPDLGGHSSAPYSGMRLTIRWQRYLEEHLKLARDAQCQLMAFNTDTMRGRMTCTFNGQLPSEWGSEGQLIELLSGFRVIAIGKVVMTTGA